MIGDSPSPWDRAPKVDGDHHLPLFFLLVKVFAKPESDQ